jgi:hypothetical protein
MCIRFRYSANFLQLVGGKEMTKFYAKFSTLSNMPDYFVFQPISVLK